MVHDRARELAREIMESEEYREYAAAKQSVQKNPDLVNALNDYQEKQFDMQKRQMVGEPIGADIMGQMQNLYQILARDPAAAAYLQAQVRFTLLVNDVYEILGEVLKK